MFRVLLMKASFARRDLAHHRTALLLTVIVIHLQSWVVVVVRRVVVIVVTRMVVVVVVVVVAEYLRLFEISRAVGLGLMGRWIVHDWWLHRSLAHHNYDIYLSAIFLSPSSIPLNVSVRLFVRSIARLFLLPISLNDLPVLWITIRRHVIHGKKTESQTCRSETLCHEETTSNDEPRTFPCGRAEIWHWSKYQNVTLDYSNFRGQRRAPP